VLVGGGAALALTRLLGDLLYQVSPRDPVAFAVAFVVMAMASIAASLVPAWRASRTDPVQALR
jgi:ABC-type lipoprotein release transport system permease subunit